MFPQEPPGPAGVCTWRSPALTLTPTLCSESAPRPPPPPAPLSPWPGPALHWAWGRGGEGECGGHRVTESHEGRGRPAKGYERNPHGPRAPWSCPPRELSGRRGQGQGSEWAQGQGQGRLGVTRVRAHPRWAQQIPDCRLIRNLPTQRSRLGPPALLMNPAEGTVPPPRTEHRAPGPEGSAGARGVGETRSLTHPCPQAGRPCWRGCDRGVTTTPHSWASAGGGWEQPGTPRPLGPHPSCLWLPSHWRYSQQGSGTRPRPGPGRQAFVPAESLSGMWQFPL